jgi:hypothetical protein
LRTDGSTDRPLVGGLKEVLQRATLGGDFDGCFLHISLGTNGV